MTRKRVCLLGSLIVAVVVACSGPQAEPLGSTSQALTPVPDTGFIPYPNRTLNFQQLPGPDGKPVPNWGGSVVDLMAADAWALCTQGTTRSSADDAAEADAYLARLRDLIAASRCTLTGAGNFEAARWLVHRQDPECNFDTSTGAKARVTFPAHPRAEYAIPTPSASDLPAPNSTIRFQAVVDAQQEVDVAEVNLCMAQRLREHMATADTLIASSQDLRQLLEVIRERVQIAMLQYTLIGNALYNNDPVTSNAITHPRQIVAVFDFWRQQLGTDALRRFGQDFAAAIKLHVDVTRELGELLLRSASARSEPETFGQSTGEQMWGRGSARRKLLSLLYGGDPLSNETTFRPRFVDVDTSHPKVWDLLGFARQADAFYLKVAPRIGSCCGIPAGFTLFDRIDIDYSTDRLYRAVEADLRNRECVRNGGSNCTLTHASAEIPPVTSFESDYLLWTKYRIAPDQARTLVQMLAQSMPMQGAGNTPDFRGSWMFTGEHRFIPEAETPSELPGETGPFYHLDPAFRTLPLTNEELSSSFVSWNTNFRIPHVMRKLYSGRAQGFVARSPGHFAPNPSPSGFNRFVDGSMNAAMRTMGAAAALAATRQGIVQGVLNTPGGTSAPYWVEAVAAFPLIEAAIGRRTAAFLPVLQNKVETNLVPPNLGLCGEWEFNGVVPTSCNSLAQTADAQGNVLYRLSVLTHEDEPNTSAVAGVARGLENTAAIDPNFRSPSGTTRATLEAFTASPLAFQTTAGLPVRATADFFLPPQKIHSVFLRRPSGTGYAYSVVGDGWQVYTLSSLRNLGGAYAAASGFLGRMVAQAWAVQANNWSKPAFDGFGLRTDWIPPQDGELLGVSSGASAVEYFLGAARRAADEATEAVRSAIDNLLREQSDSVAASLASQKAREISDLERKSLCGNNNLTCNTASRSRDITSLFPDINCTTTFCEDLAIAIANLVPSQVVLADEVWKVADQTSPPSFSEFAGGELQTVLLAQWQALRGVVRAIADARALAVAKTSEVTAANAALMAAQSSADAAAREAAIACSDGALHDAISAGYSYAGVEQGDLDTAGTDLENGGWRYHLTYNNDGRSWSPGPMIAALQTCRSARTQAELAGTQPAVAAAHYAAVVYNARSAMSTQHTALAQAGAALQTASAALTKTLVQTELVKAQAEFEARLTLSSLTTRFGTARRYHAYDIWRARALLENARRYSIAARRAIESQFVVDMTTMLAPEPFVAAPADWVDEAYEYDLSAPAAVGLVRSQPVADGIYPNKLSDYVRNLDAFVAGYSVARPTSIARSDSEILSLPGPDLRSETADGTVVTSSESAGWLFFCDATGTWITHPGIGQDAAVDLATACDGRPPTRARISFQIDPWARLQGDIAEPPFEARHNVRWVHLAVNIVGTGVLDCERAAEPLDCYSQSFLRYALKHHGPSWVTDFDGQWHIFDVTTGQIEGGKALAVEEWLDPVSNGWAKPLVQAVARSELSGRPVGGEYVLELELSPEVRPERIERVQLLQETKYWVKQLQ